MTVFSASKLVRVAALAAAMGAAGLFAMPAMAAPAAPAASISFAVSSGYHLGAMPVQHYRPNRHNQRYCMNDSQVRRAISRSGYDRVRVFSSRGPLVEARAVRRGATYAIRFDSCRGVIRSAVRLHRR